MRLVILVSMCLYFSHSYLGAVGLAFSAQSVQEKTGAKEQTKEQTKGRNIKLQGEIITEAGEKIIIDYRSGEKAGAAKKSAQDSRRAGEEGKKAGGDAMKAAQDARKEALDAARDARKELKSTAQRLRDADDSILRAARTLRMQGLYQESANLYSKLISDKPDSPRLYEARFWYAKSLLSAEKWDQAADAFTDFLKFHSDQRMYSQQAKEDRIYCWKMRIKQNPKAAPGLKAALSDKDLENRVLAALALAENKDASGRKALEEGLGNAKLSEQCGLALWKLGLRDQPNTGATTAPLTRMLVIRVKSVDDSFEMRVPATFIKSLEKMVPAEAMEQLAQNGMNEILGQVATAPKGQVLFEYKGDKGKTSVVISVE